MRIRLALEKMEEGGPEVRAEMWGPIVTEASDEYYCHCARGTNNTGELVGMAQALMWLIAVHEGHTLQHDELLHELAAGTIYVLGADEQRAEDSGIVAEQEREPRPKRKRLLRESSRTGMGR